MSKEMAADVKQDNLVKELLIDIDESLELESVPDGVPIELLKLLKFFEEPNCPSHYQSSLGSDAENPHLPDNRERNEVYTRTHNNDTNMEMTPADKLEEMVKLLSDIESPESKSIPGQPYIYRVPRRIRSVNEKAYTPELVSIGPLHHGKKELDDMEKKKEKYVKSFFQRITEGETKKEEKIKKIQEKIKDNEKQIREYYVETSLPKDDEFIKMILYDSIFIIEIFLRVNGDESDKLLLDTKSAVHTLRTDLELFENQLPYFILEEIHKLAFSEEIHKSPTFMDLSIKFFGKFMGVGLCSPTSHQVIKHFTDWRRISLLKGCPKVLEKDKDRVYDLPCAVKLRESGIKFKLIEIERAPSVLDVKFGANELRIPRLEVYDSTERLLRNIMALEQCLYREEAQICNYVELMDCLINSEVDVDFLVGNKIISNHIGDDASVATMFNKLNRHIPVSKSSYHGLCEQLKKHHKNPLNRTKATLKRVYFNDLWRGTATVAGVLLLLPTIVQTVCSILQVVKFN